MTTRDKFYAELRSVTRRSHFKLANLERSVDFLTEKEMSTVERALLRMAVTALWVLDRESTTVRPD